MSEQKPRTRTITSPMIIPQSKRIISKKHPLYSGIMLPGWGGNLDFRAARAEESAHLKTLYELAWGAGITISEKQIKAKITNFPEGQIVGVEKGHDAPISMINIMLMVLRRGGNFDGGYEKVTGGRTFSTSLKPLELLEILDQEAGTAIGIASCVSVATHPDYSRFGYAHETLNYAIMFSLANHLTPAPYSAPRGFSRARIRNPDLDILHYLHMTKPINREYESYLGKMIAISRRLCPAFSGETGLSKRLFTKYQQIKADSPSTLKNETAYFRFLAEDGVDFHSQYGRMPTIEDFCIQSGRILLDPVIGMHVHNGARFIRGEEGKITAVFPDSRPEDQTALGYNIVLSYGYHKLLGHAFS